MSERGKKQHTQRKKHKHLYQRNALFFIFDRISLEELKILCKSTTTCLHHRTPKSNIFPLNILCLFSLWHWKGNERGDSKRTIYFEWPNIVINVFQERIHRWQQIRCSMLPSVVLLMLDFGINFPSKSLMSMDLMINQKIFGASILMVRKWSYF